MFSMNEKFDDKMDVRYNKAFYIETYSCILRSMKGSLYWPNIGFPGIISPNIRRMFDKPKKHSNRNNVKNVPSLVKTMGYHGR